MLEGSQESPSLAVFPLIDEACRLPRATYQVHSLQDFMVYECVSCHNSTWKKQLNSAHLCPLKLSNSLLQRFIRSQLCASEAFVCTADRLPQRCSSI